MDPWSEDSPWQPPSTSTLANPSSTNSPPLPPQSDPISDPWASNSPIKEKIPIPFSRKDSQNDSNVKDSVSPSSIVDPWSSGGASSIPLSNDNLTPKANSDLPLPSTSASIAEELPISSSVQDGGWGESLESSYQPPSLSSDPWGSDNITSSRLEVGKESERVEDRDDDRTEGWNPSAGQSSLQTSSSSWYEPKLDSNSETLQDVTIDENEPWGGSGGGGISTTETETTTSSPKPSLPSLSGLSISADNRSDLVKSIVGGSGDSSKRSEDEIPIPKDLDKDKESKKEEDKSTTTPSNSKVGGGGFLSSWRNRIGTSNANTSSSNPNDPSMGSIQASEPIATPTITPQSTTAPSKSTTNASKKETEAKDSSGGATSLIGGLFKRREAPEISSAVSDDEDETSFDKSMMKKSTPGLSDSTQTLSDPFDIASPDPNVQADQQPQSTVGKLFGRWGKRSSTQEPKNQNQGGQDWKDQDFDFLNNVSSTNTNAGIEVGKNDDLLDDRGKSLDHSASNLRNEQDWFESFEESSSSTSIGGSNNTSTTTKSGGYPSTSTSPPNKFLVSSTSRGSINGNRPQIQGINSINRSTNASSSQNQKGRLDFDVFESLGESSTSNSNRPQPYNSSGTSQTTSSNFVIPPPPAPSSNSGLNRSQSLNAQSTSLGLGTKRSSKPIPPSNLGFGFVSKHTNQTKDLESRVFSNESQTSSRVTSGGTTESANSQDAFGNFGDWETKPSQNLTNSNQSNVDQETRVPSVPPTSRGYGNPAFNPRFSKSKHQPNSSISSSSYQERFSDNFEPGTDDLEDRFEYYDGDDDEHHPHAEVYDLDEGEIDYQKQRRNQVEGNYSDNQLNSLGRIQPPPLPNKDSELPSVINSNDYKRRSISPLPPLPKNSFDNLSDGGSSSRNSMTFGEKKNEIKNNSRPVSMIGNPSSTSSSNPIGSFLPPPPAPARKAVQSNSNRGSIIGSNNSNPLIPPPPPPTSTSTTSVPPPPTSIDSPALRQLKMEESQNNSSSNKRGSLSADDLSFFDSL